MGKLTLNIDDAVTLKSKKYAEKQNTSVSHLVEEFLKRITADYKNAGVFDEVFGIWEGKKITGKSLREKAWRK